MSPSGSVRSRTWGPVIQRAGPPEHYDVTSGWQPVPLLTPQLPGAGVAGSSHSCGPRSPVTLGDKQALSSLQLTDRSPLGRRPEERAHIDRGERHCPSRQRKVSEEGTPVGSGHTEWPHTLASCIHWLCDRGESLASLWVSVSAS